MMRNLGSHAPVRGAPRSLAPLLTAAPLKCQSSVAAATATGRTERARVLARTGRRAVIGDDSGSTPGNPHTVDGEGPDISQNAKQHSCNTEVG